MKMTHRSSAQLATFALGLSLTAAFVFAQGGDHAGHMVIPADKVQFTPGPPTLPAGAQVAVFEGNPAEAGPITLRLKFPANYTVPPHWHSKTERVTVIAGALNLGSGDAVNRQASQKLDPGGFALLPARMHHYAWTAVPTVVQLNLDGPFDVFYVNPNDDPQKK